MRMKVSSSHMRQVLIIAAFSILAAGKTFAGDLQTLHHANLKNGDYVIGKKVVLTL